MTPEQVLALHNLDLSGWLQDIVRAALKERGFLRLAYQAADGEYTYRVVGPLELSRTTYGTYHLRAFCFEREADRTFRLDRVLVAEPLDVDEAALYRARRDSRPRQAPIHNAGETHK